MSNRTLALAVWCLLVTGLPIHATESVLGRRPVELELDAARITITISAQELAARLESHVILAGDRAGNKAGDPTDDQTDDPRDDNALEVDYGDARVSVRRPPAKRNRGANGVDAGRPRLEIQVWIAADQPLRLVGSDLEVTLIGQHHESTDEATPGHEDGPADEAFVDPAQAPEEDSGTPVTRQATPTEPHDPNPPFAIELGVASSTVDLTGVVDAALALSGSRLRSEGTRGTLTIVADAGSECEVLQHDGTINLSATHSDSVVVGASGEIILDLTQANLLVRDGQGAIGGKAQGGLVVIEQWQGPSTFEATETAFELRATGPRIKLQGNSLRVTGENGRGAIEITSHQGGSVSLLDWVGRTTVSQRGDGTFESTNLRGPLVLDLRDGMRAIVTDSQSLVQASLRDAELQLEGAQALKIDSQGSVLHASRIRRLERIVATATEIDLDLQDAQSFGPIKADGASRLRLAMREPCRVVVSGGASADGGRGVNANRCFVDLASQFGRTFSPGGRRGRTSMIRIELGQGGQLDVEGHAPP